jgi:hypothetical protein
LEAGIYKKTQAFLRKNKSGRTSFSKKYIQHLYYNYDFGRKVDDELEFNSDDRLNLITKIKQENILGMSLDIILDPYPNKKNRSKIAETDRNEKKHSYPVRRDYILVNSINGFKLNKKEMKPSPFTALGLTINADHITSIEHEHIILVENLEIMAKLCELKVPDFLQDALWLYRGDKKKENQTGKAYEFFRRFTNTAHQLICFSDLDPKGVEMALTTGASHWLTPVDSTVVNMELNGVEHEWFNQDKEKKYILGLNYLPSKCQVAFKQMQEHRKTLKQEHMYAHQIPLDIYSLQE